MRLRTTVGRRPERIRAFSDITKSAIHIHVVNHQRKSSVLHFRNRIEFSNELFDRDRGARQNCIRPRRDAGRRIGVRQFAPDSKSRPGRHSGHRSQQRLFVRIQLRFILPDELLHLILREVLREPISRIRQREDCKRRVEFRGFYRGERIQKWLVLIFQSFGVMAESRIIGFSAKRTEVRKRTGRCGIIRRCTQDRERSNRQCEASGAHRSRAEMFHLLTWLSMRRPALAAALAPGALHRSPDICAPLRASRECRPACCPV